MAARQKDLEGLAFPVIRARFAGPTNYRGSRYIATMRRGPDFVIRATVNYDHALSGSQNALQAARKCWDAYRTHPRNAEIARHIDDTDALLFVPGDLDDSSYTFTVIRADFFAEGDES